jgi:hypothetical protein
MLRAQLTVAHLLEDRPRTPEKWPRLARMYLSIAAADATALERYIKARRGRQVPVRCESRVWLPPAGARPG